MSRLFHVAMAALLAVFSLTALPGNAQAEKVLRIGIPKEPANLNPVLTSEVWGESLEVSLFDTLIDFLDNPKEPSPRLAKSWTISEDGMVYTFVLRSGVVFHNGDPVTAKDVKFTIDAILDPKNASPSKEFFEPVDRVEVVDSLTVRIVLKSPYAPFMLALANPTAGIIPEKVVSEIGMDRFDRAPIGSGPYRFAEWVPDDRIVLAKNAQYFLKEPNLDKVIFRPIPKPEVMAAELQSGGIDLGAEILPQDMKRLERDGLKVYSIPGLSSRYIGFNAKIAPYSDIRFRKALYHAIPINRAMTGIFRDSAERVYSWIPTGVLGDDVAYMKSKVLPFDEEKAQALFDAMKADGTITDATEIVIYSPQDAPRRKVATVISSVLRKFGIKSRVESLEWGSLMPILKGGDAGLYVVGWGSVPEPDRWTYKIFMPDSVMNFSRYDNPEVTRALRTARVETDRATREALYVGAMRQALVTDVIHIPLVLTRTINVASPKVSDFAPTPQKYINLVSGKRNVDLR